MCFGFRLSLTDSRASVSVADALEKNFRYGRQGFFEKRQLSFSFNPPA